MNKEELLLLALKNISDSFIIMDLENNDVLYSYNFDKASLNDFDKHEIIEFNNKKYLVKVNQKENYLSNIDELTKLPRREAIRKKIHEYEKNNIPFLMLLLDIDKFKEINDTYGHLIGDEILTCAVNIIKHNIKADNLLSRWGGDEFMAILPQVDISLISDRFDKINERLKSGIYIKSYNDKISVSISYGIISYDYSKNFDENYQLVDDLLYEEKSKHHKVKKLIQ